MTNKTTIVKCPQCGTPVEWTDKNPYRPFCSKKCQLIDFGTWTNGENAIPGAPDMSDADGWSEEHQ